MAMFVRITCARRFSMTPARVWCIAASTLLGSASWAQAEAVHYDVFVTSSGTGTKLVIGGYDDDALTATVPAEQMRVFGGEVVGSGTAAPYESAAPGEPGFRAGSQSFLDNPSLMSPAAVYKALSGSAALTFTFQPIAIGAATRNLFYWDGVGAVQFAPIGGNVVLGLEKQGAGGWTALITGTSSGVVSGNTIQNSTATGGVHTHLFTSIGTDGAAPAQGFYLFSIQLAMAGYNPSDPLYFVFGALDPDNLAPQFADFAAFEAAHGAAELWVEETMAVPEPTAWLLTVCGAATIAGARRRRQDAPAHANWQE